MMEEIKKRFLIIGSNSTNDFWTIAEIRSIFFFIFIGLLHSLNLFSVLSRVQWQTITTCKRGNLNSSEELKIEFFILMTDDDDDEF